MVLINNNRDISGSNNSDTQRSVNRFITLSVVVKVIVMVSTLLSLGLALAGCFVGLATPLGISLFAFGFSAMGIAFSTILMSMFWCPIVVPTEENQVSHVSSIDNLRPDSDKENKIS